MKVWYIIAKIYFWKDKFEKEVQMPVEIIKNTLKINTAIRLIKRNNYEELN